MRPIRADQRSAARQPCLDQNCRYSFAVQNFRAESSRFDGPASVNEGERTQRRLATEYPSASGGCEAPYASRLPCTFQRFPGKTWTPKVGTNELLRVWRQGRNRNSRAAIVPVSQMRSAYETSRTGTRARSSLEWMTLIFRCRINDLRAISPSLALDPRAPPVA